MNKQQLASKIWESANKMRSKIEANEYKDYILGFIFYKFLSDKEEKYFTEMGLNNLKELKEENKEYKEYSQKNLGYYITYNDLFSTWLAKKKDFDVSDVRDALSRFERLINKSHEKVFKGIFDTLQTGLSKLGDTTKTQTNAIWDLIYLIKDIPMDGKQDYDVLGFIYEYLISNFAANAGKKAGEFYTPHEVSQLMSDIIADYLKNRDEISIYDPTSGSGSLLINIGKSVSKYVKDPNNIKYYAQELKQNTYNLTRMNLVMRGIIPGNITTRNGDTLESDWPYFDENDPERTYNPLYVDAVVSNPPYSQNWDPTDRENDARYKSYGLAPKSKADYAFLLHDLYHLKSDGIMTIVLPHGVLFRGGEEGEIRKNLIEKNNIDTIIGLPANIFFGTGIPTIIMILKKNKSNTDVHIIDASKGFIKEGKNNKLRACDIKKIVDAVINRVDIPKFSKVVSRDEIRENDYNLNIPRYVDSSEETETYDIYASMFGGIPNTELKKLDNYFTEFPELKNDLFNKLNDSYFELKQRNLEDFVNNHKDIIDYKNKFNHEISILPKYFENELIDNITNVNIINEKEKLSNRIFEIFDKFKLIDNYNAYQILDDEYTIIANDLELIETEGIDAIKLVDPNMIIKKKNNQDIEVQDGWKGHIIPFELVQKLLLFNEVKELNDKKNRLDEITSNYSEILDSMSEDDKESITDVLNDTNDSFVNAEVKKMAAKIKKDKLALNEDMIEYKIVEVNDLLEEEKELKKSIKNQEAIIQDKSKKAIENLSNEQVRELLIEKWINPIIINFNCLLIELINNLVDKIKTLSNKYNTTLIDTEKETKNCEKDLCFMLDELVGNDFDMKGISEFKSLLNGELNG